MESQHDKPSSIKSQNSKGIVDFYGNVQERCRQKTPTVGSDYRQREHYEMDVDFEVEAIQVKSNNNKSKPTNNNPIYFSGSEQSQSSAKITNLKAQEGRKSSQEKTGGRQSIEGRERQLQNRQLEQNARQSTGAKSAMQTYIPQALNSLGGNNIKTGVEQNQETYGSQSSYSSKNVLQKVQSQNRIMIASQEVLQGVKNSDGAVVKPQKGQQEKISFFKESNKEKRAVTGSGQDLLYKHHLQYSNANSKPGATYQLKHASQLILSHCSTKECTFCKNPISAATCSAIFCNQYQLGTMMQNQLSKKYSTNRDYYNVKIVNDLIYNENTHIVSIFKDYLILDDINEFLKRPYTTSETKVRLPKLCSFYDKYSQVFPNYVILPESKYMFKNIQRKQKLIDEIYQIQEDQAKRKQQPLLDEDKLFNSKFYNSVYKLTDMSMSRQQYEDQAKQIAHQVGRKPNRGRLEEMKIEDLVERFLVKDSESNIQLQTTTGIEFSELQQSVIEKTPAPKQENKKQAHRVQVPNSKETTAKSKQTTVKKIQEIGGKKISTGYPYASTVTAGVVAQAQAKVKQTKNSFNNVQKNQNGAGTNKQSQQSSNQQIKSDSQKNTPRFIKQAREFHNQDNQSNEQTTSPATKEALSTYLQGQLDNHQPTQIPKKLNPKIVDKNKVMVSLESPSIKSPTTQSMKNLMPSGSQSSLYQQQHNGLAVTRQYGKQYPVATTSLGHTAHINNMKKGSHRQSNEGPQKQIAAKKAVSPHHQNFVHQNSVTNQSLGSRNTINNSTNNKTVKNVNSHAKYLSGGSEQYQRLLNPTIIGSSLGSSETFNSNNINSSSKKANIHSQKVKSTGKNKQIHHMADEMITGEDCDDAGIADERFASPDIYITEDQNLRKSMEGRPISTMQNQILISSNDEKMILSQYTNYDQIKKHLEQIISSNPQTQHPYSQSLVETNSTQQQSVKKVHYQKLPDQKPKDLEYKRHGSNRNQVMSSGQASIYNDTNNSRNASGVQKQFESLKNRIRGAFEKTEKSSSPKKLQSTKNQNNRMSLEAKEIMMNANNLQGCLSSTSAAGRALNFNNHGFNSTQNYRSITNLNNRKSSKHNLRESMNESQKRYSQNRQSFRELQAHEKMIKRCATGKTLAINEIQSHTFGGHQNQQNLLASMQSSSTLMNPTFIANNNSITQKQQQLSNSNVQQQAANTVRVMTPSYSLASLSKMVTPNNQASPLTMTVQLATQGRKQPNMQNFHSHHQNNPSFGSTGSPVATFTLVDKNNKIVKHQQNSLTSKVSKMTKQASNAVQFNKKTGGGQQNIQNQQTTPRAQGAFSTDVQRRQYIPDGVIQENSHNLSCTVSTEHNSGNFTSIICLAAKALESKHPKFMKTIEEVVSPQQANSQIGSQFQRSGMTSSSSLINLDIKLKQALSNTQQKKMVSQLTSSQSVAQFKQPTGALQAKKLQGRHQQYS